MEGGREAQPLEASPGDLKVTGGSQVRLQLQNAQVGAGRWKQQSQRQLQNHSSRPPESHVLPQPASVGLRRLYVLFSRYEINSLNFL